MFSMFSFSLYVGIITRLSDMVLKFIPKVHILSQKKKEMQKTCFINKNIVSLHLN